MTSFRDTKNDTKHYGTTPQHLVKNYHSSQHFVKQMNSDMLSIALTVVSRNLMARVAATPR